MAQGRPFLSGKGPKTSDAPSGIIEGEGRQPLRRADQLAPLKQGPLADKSVPPLGQPAGVNQKEVESRMADNAAEDFYVDCGSFARMAI